MTEQLISFETAKLAQEKGFNEYCKNVYAETLPHTITSQHNGNEYDYEYTAPRVMPNDIPGDHEVVICSAPTQSLLQKWLREKHNIHMAMKHMSNGFICDVQIAFVRSIKMVVQPTYEEALEQSLIEALKLIP